MLEIYARKSDEKQKATSIEDQFRNCRKVAQGLGLETSDDLTFFDDSITGKKEGNLKRLGFQRMLDAFHAGKVTVLVADELSRLSRNYSAGAVLMDLVEEHGLRIVTTDGIDTADKTWKTVWAVKMLLAVQEVDSTSERTQRGMIGALMRGYQIAPPPYGYRGVRELCIQSRKQATRWVIDAAEADVVRKIFALRYRGVSVVAIAAELNDAGIMPPAFKRCKNEPFWRAGTVCRLLQNPTYRGVVFFNASSWSKARARRRRKDLEVLEFERPYLRLVTDEVWQHANTPSSTANRARCPRGGGKHLLAGLVRCGDCRAMLSVAGGPKSFGMRCPQCEMSARAKGKTSWMGYTSHEAGVRALRAALHLVFSPELRQEFSERLKFRLRSGPEVEVSVVKLQLKDCGERKLRLKALISNPKLDPELFADELSQTQSEERQLKARLQVLEKRLESLSLNVIQAQSKVDPLDMLDEMLDGKGPPTWEVKAMLRRLLVKFEFVQRPASGTSVFEIEFTPGVLLSEQSGTDYVDTWSVKLRVTVCVGKSRPSKWTVDVRRSACDLL
jgi:DNA invertase Pin-like site-specific DNA recombinase